MIAKIFASFFLFQILSACSHSGSIWTSPSEDYRKFLSGRIEEAQLFDRGRSVLKVRALLVDAELVAAQSKFTPGHTIEPKNDQVQVLAALEMSTRETFMPEDFQFFINGLSPVHVREISNQTELEQHYPFAYPYLRLFVLEFSALDLKLAEVNQLKIQSPVGLLELPLHDHARKEN